MPHRLLPTGSVFLSPFRRACAGAWLALGAATALAQPQPDPAGFPLDAVGYLNEELPRMDAAVATKDRSFFFGAMTRTVQFSERWGFKAKANPDLAAYPMCTAAVMDYAVVGMCKLTPAADACEPGLAPRFDANLKRCRELAAQK
jgi:hypothetical protein